MEKHQAGGKMMQLNISSPWHEASFNEFVDKRLPELLSARVPLGGYRVELTGSDTLSLHIILSVEGGKVAVAYTEIPRPDTDGVFKIDEQPWLVVPEASDENLETASISCVGDQLYDFIDQRLGLANGDLPWDQSLARAWLPLDKWFREFFAITPTAQPLDATNWISGKCHLHRVLIPSEDGLLKESHFGRTCPFETPEGPMIGRVLSVAVGAEIRDGKLLIVDDSPEAGLGITASMIPLLEHDDANRLLMGANMLRQCVEPPDPEPALVRTGNEPDVPRFWCGRNLLTAYISMGGDTYEDSIVVSESCAARLDFPHALEPGDKMSNRHGTKGTISRILPDDQMPCLSDGTPVELAFSFVGCQSRLNFGQIREAALSRIAAAEGRPFVAAPYQAPDEEQIRDRLKRNGLPVSGMETLILDGRKLRRPSTVGWVYWGKLWHLAKDKIRASALPKAASQVVGEMEYHALRDIGAYENILESINLRSIYHKDASQLPDQVVLGRPQQAEAPTPCFASLKERLGVAGIRLDFNEEQLAFHFEAPAGPVLKLARPIPHPWMHERELAVLGEFKEMKEYEDVLRANAKAERMIADKMPDSLTESALEQLEKAVSTFFRALLVKEHLKVRGRAAFSGRAVISVGPELHLDQIGVAEEMAWELFGPLVQRDMGNPREVSERTPGATRVLDDIMARSWVLLNRAPTIMPTSILAFHPVRTPDRVLRIHPLICPAMNADFDGDQAALYLPLTEAAQQEAGHMLSVAGHIRRDPKLLRLFCPKQTVVWGLADLSLTSEGHQEIETLADAPVAAPEGYVTRDTIAAAVHAVMERDGVDAALACVERLMHRGFKAARDSGASMSPFIGSSVAFPPVPAGEDLETWRGYAEICGERIAARSDFDSDDIGPQLLAVKTMARGNMRQLAWLLGPRGSVVDTTGRPRHIIRRGLAEGMSHEEVQACVVGARRGLARVVLDYLGETRDAYGVRAPKAPKGFNALARAMCAENPGVVLAIAAAGGEVDPLRDVDSRLFVGLKPL